MRSRTRGRPGMDMLFVLLIAVLYAATDLLVRAVVRLRDPK